MRAGLVSVGGESLSSFDVMHDNLGSVILRFWDDARLYWINLKNGTIGSIVFAFFSAAIWVYDKFFKGSLKNDNPSARKKKDSRKDSHTFNEWMGQTPNKIMLTVILVLVFIAYTSFVVWRKADETLYSLTHVTRHRFLSHIDKVAFGIGVKAVPGYELGYQDSGLHTADDTTKFRSVKVYISIRLDTGMIQSDVKDWRMSIPSLGVNNVDAYQADQDYPLHPNQNGFSQKTLVFEIGDRDKDSVRASINSLSVSFLDDFRHIDTVRFEDAIDKNLSYAYKVGDERL